MRPSHAPGPNVEFILAEDHQDAMRHGVHLATTNSTDMTVDLIAGNVADVGTALATNTPPLRATEHSERGLSGIFGGAG